MRKGFLIAGGVVLAVGIVLAVVANLEVAMAIQSFSECFSNPVTVTPGCVAAMSTMMIWQGLAWLSYVLALVGVVLLILGAVLAPERPPMTLAPPPPPPP